MSIPKAQEIYRHFKGKVYQIVTLAEHTETGEVLVIYQAMYDDFKIYARPLSMFMEKVDKIKYPEAMQEYRFEKVETMCVAADAVPGCEKLNAISEEKTQEEATQPDPLLMEFLDADTYEERLNILAALYPRITDDMITTMAIACDVEIAEDSLENRYSQLKHCLMTLDRYEINRIR